MTDQQLVTAVQARNTEAFAMLYDRYSGALYGIIHRILQNEEIAEEALSTGFLKVWDRINEYQPGRYPVFSWLLKIIRAVALEKRKVIQPDDLVIERGCNGETDDEAFILVWCRGCSKTETAGLLGITEEEVGLRIRKTLKELQLSKA